MVWHDNECVELDGWKLERKLTPYRPHSIAGAITFHFVIDDTAKNATAIWHAKGKEVAAGLGVVVPVETNRAAGRIRIDGHAEIIY